ncbi:MAG: hypothetical protein CL908_06285 [Deltaproteobacteria bacterium]|nr:hypothetical protein [Deltaproteobacteria bacterium]
MRPNAPWRGSLFVLFLVLLPLSVKAQRDVPCDEGCKTEYLDVTTGVDPEPDLNCDVMALQRLMLPAIVQNDGGGDPVRSAEMRHFGKRLVRQAFAWGMNQTPAWPPAQIAGMELDWFLLGDPPTVDRLPDDLTLRAPDGTIVAKLYSFDAAQYVARRAALEAMMGHPLREFPTWLAGAVGAVTSSAQASGCRVRSVSNAIYGDVHSAGSLRVVGRRNVLHDGASFTTGASVAPGNVVTPLVQTATAPPGVVPSLLLDESSARALAMSAGTYYPGSVCFGPQNLPPSGLVFAEGSITLRMNRAEVVGTFAAVGRVSIKGRGLLVRAHTALVAAVSYRDRIRMDGHALEVVGELHAPEGSLTLRGTGNVFLGPVVARRVGVGGARNVISDGTHPWTP